MDLLTLIIWLAAGIILAIAWSMAHAAKDPLRNCDYKCTDCGKECKFNYDNDKESQNAND